MWVWSKHGDSITAPPYKAEFWKNLVWFKDVLWLAMIARPPPEPRAEFLAAKCTQRQCLSWCVGSNADVSSARHSALSPSGPLDSSRLKTSQACRIVWLEPVKLGCLEAGLNICLMSSIAVFMHRASGQHCSVVNDSKGLLQGYGEPC